jgi:lipopolysaccharide transport system permease protein
MTFVVQIWMYATPIVYPLSQVPEEYRLWYSLNPMVAIVESFRYAFLGSGVLEWIYIGMSWLVTFIILFCGVILFSRIEKTFMDTI